MRKRVVLILVIIFLFSHSSSLADTGVGEIVYAEIIDPPETIFVFRGVNEDLHEVANTLVYPENTIVDGRYQYFNEDYIVRVRIYNDELAEVIPELGSNPYSDLGQRVFLPLSSLRTMLSEEFSVLSLHPDTLPSDKLIVVTASDRPEIALFEGYRLVMKVPVILGPTPRGDFRVFMTRASDDMPSVSSVPFVNYFTNGYAIHGSPWWNWRNRTTGGYGSRGCVNLPDETWFNVLHDGRYIGVDEWIYRWISTNIDYSEFSNEEKSFVSSQDPGWYMGTSALRTVVVSDVYDLFNYPPSSRLGSNGSSIAEMSMIVDALVQNENNWLLPGQTIAIGTSVAGYEGDPDDGIIVMLDCDVPSSLSSIAFEGSTRTTSEACDFMRTQISGSICFVERYDLEYFGKHILCDRRSFESLPASVRGELIEHESVHLRQFSGYFKELYLSGVSVEDSSIGYVNFSQNSVIGVAELMAQTSNIESPLGDDYSFALVVIQNGQIISVDGSASLEQAWTHLERECSGSQLPSNEVRGLLEQGLSGAEDAYVLLEELCSAPPHRLVPDRVRSG